MTVVRWLGKPTSGRFVYSNGYHEWAWQCDLHGDEYDADPKSYMLRDDIYGFGSTMEETLEKALEHAKVCPYDNRW